MNGFIKLPGWILFAFLAVTTSMYPLMYIGFDPSTGLLATKPPALLQSWIWRTLFYLHISFGGLSLLTGWSQFSKYLRDKNLGLHRWLGKIYIVSVAISGPAGLCIAWSATGGIITITGFSALAIAWTIASARAYLSVRRRDIDAHRDWMIRSYALCWAAVTLRLWIPLLCAGFGLEFLTAYKLVAWLCWIPNALVAEVIINRIRVIRNVESSYQPQ